MTKPRYDRFHGIAPLVPAPSLPSPCPHPPPPPPLPPPVGGGGAGGGAGEGRDGAKEWRRTSALTIGPIREPADALTMMASPARMAATTWGSSSAALFA